MLVADLTATEPSLTDTSGANTVASVVQKSANGFTVTTQSKSDKWFTFTRTATAQAMVVSADTPLVARRAIISSRTPVVVRERLASQDGFGIIEVLVSALIVVLVSLGVFAAIDAAGRTTDANKSRSSASALAQSDQERLRSMSISALANLDDTQTNQVDGEDYSVRSRGEYVFGPADATVCSSSEQAPRYLKITSTVTWPDIRGVNPVEQTSLRTVPNGSATNSGTLTVGIEDAAGNGVAGVAVTASGPQLQSGTTNSEGCAVFGFIKPGTYAISASKAGYVDPSNPTNPTLSGSVVAAADGVASKSFQYDQAGGVTVSYKTSPFGVDPTPNTGANLTATNGDGFTIANSGLGSLNYKTFTHVSGPSGSSGLVNFPFTSAYTAWSGKCNAENTPTAAALGKWSQAALVPEAGTVTVTALEPRLRVKVQRRTNGTTTATNNYAVMTNDNKTSLKFSPTTTSCTTPAATTGPFTSATAVTKPVADTTASGGTNGNFSTFEAILPYGTYTVCASYNGGAGMSGAVTASGVTNATAAGSLYGTILTVPYTSTQTTCP